MAVVSPKDSKKPPLAAQTNQAKQLKTDCVRLCSSATKPRVGWGKVVIIFVLMLSRGSERTKAANCMALLQAPRMPFKSASMPVLTLEPSPSSSPGLGMRIVLFVSAWAEQGEW
eukprot:5949206-Alexandrium_andersonii.AAC.1